MKIFRYSLKAKLTGLIVGILLGTICFLVFVLTYKTTVLLKAESEREITQALKQSGQVLASFLKANDMNLELWVSTPLIKAFLGNPAMVSVFYPNLKNYFSKIIKKEPWIKSFILLSENSIAYDDSGIFHNSKDQIKLLPKTKASKEVKTLINLPLDKISIFNLSTFDPKQDKNVAIIKRQLETIKPKST